MLQSDSLLPTLNIVRLCLAVYLLELAIKRVKAHAAHLLCNHIARKRDNTYIVTRGSLDSDYITNLQIEVIDILIE